MAELKGNKYGTHRVIEPKGVLTQAPLPSLRSLRPAAATRRRSAK